MNNPYKEVRTVYPAIERLDQILRATPGGVNGESFRSALRETTDDFMAEYKTAVRGGNIVKAGEVTEVLIAISKRWMW